MSFDWRRIRYPSVKAAAKRIASIPAKTRNFFKSFMRAQKNNLRTLSCKTLLTDREFPDQARRLSSAKRSRFAFLHKICGAKMGRQQVFFEPRAFLADQPGL